jgi:hypothetical protein
MDFNHSAKKENFPTKTAQTEATIGSAIACLTGGLTTVSERRVVR